MAAAEQCSRRRLFPQWNGYRSGCLVGVGKDPLRWHHCRNYGSNFTLRLSHFVVSKMLPCTWDPAPDICFWQSLSCRCNRLIHSFLMEMLTARSFSISSKNASPYQRQARMLWICNWMATSPIVEGYPRYWKGAENWLVYPWTVLHTPFLADVIYAAQIL